MFERRRRCLRGGGDVSADEKDFVALKGIL
jgi:hypothetical protein